MRAEGEAIAVLWDVLAFFGILAVLYVALALAATVITFRVARSADRIPRSLDCRDGRHAACTTCSCRCHS